MDKVIVNIDRINETAWKECRKNPELAIKKSKEALTKAKKNKYLKGETMAIHTMGNSYAWLSEFDKASDFLQKSLGLYISQEDQDGSRIITAV